MSHRPVLALPLMLAACGLAACGLAACSPDEPKDEVTDTGEPAADTGEEVIPPSVCDTLGLPEALFDDTEPAEYQRHEPAGDFEVALRDGTTWTLSESWTGCDTYIFIPHYFPISAHDNDTMWSTGVDELLERSPPNVHYFFVVPGTNDDDAESYGAAMDDWVSEALASLDEADYAWWSERVHVVAGPSGDQDGLVRQMGRTNVGYFGWGIDRTQKIRSIGYFPDVAAYDSGLNSAGEWPWEMELYSAAREVEYFNFEAERQVALDAVTADIVEVFGGDVVEEYVDGTMTLPDAATMAGYDTLEVDVRMECPDADGPEISNCGAWDYLAHMWLWDDATETWMEMARFITTYHRESRWVVDGTHALGWLQDGGERTVRYQWAPSWNTQPTGVTVQLRLSNQGKGVAPRQTIALFTGGAFGSTYNDRDPVEVEIPSTATRVDLVALTTGHGMDNGNCAEFCDQEHTFSIGSESWSHEMHEPGIDDACANSVGTGTVPNQAGTWWFGRGGWCPGRRVEPFTVDVTSQAAPGDAVSVMYEGTRNGATPVDGSGNIEHRSWLVIYE